MSTFNILLVTYAMTGSQTKITGYTSLYYTERFPDNDSQNSFTQTLNLRWIDQLYRNKVTMGLDLYISKPDSEDFQIRPTWSIDVRGYQYTLIAKFQEYRDDEYQGGESTLITKIHNLNLILTPPDLPRVSITYTSNRYLDDQEIHAVNSKTETKSIKADHQIGDLSISASHVEYSFWSKPETSDIESFAGLIALAMDPSGYVYTLSNLTYKVQVYTSNGSFVREWGEFGTGVGQFTNPIGIAVDKSGYVYVTDEQLHNVQKFTFTGDYVAQWGGFGFEDGRFNRPNGISVDEDGNVYIVDQGNQRIQKFTSAGGFISSFGISGSGEEEFNEPSGITIDQFGNIYITDAGNHRIQKFSSTYDFLMQWGTFGTNNGEFNFPTGIASDDQGYVYVMDYGNQRVQRFTNTGVFVNKWNVHGSVSGNVIDIGSGVQLFLADQQNGLVEIYSQDGAFLSYFGNFVTVTSTESRYETKTDQLALNYAFRPSEYIDFNFGFNVTDTIREGTSISTTDSLYQQYSFGWRVYPLDYISFYGNHNWTLSEVETNNRTTEDSDNNTHDFGLQLKPYNQTNVNLGYSRSEYTESTTSNTRSESASFQVSTKLYPDLNLSLNASHSETFSMDTKTSISDQVSMVLTAQLLPDAAADLVATHNQTDNLQDDSENSSNSLALRWRSRPTDKFIWNETIQWSNVESKTVSDGTTSHSKSNQIGLSTEMNYWMYSWLNLFMNSTYTMNDTQSDNFNYTTGFTWRPRNRFYTSNSISQSLGESDSTTISSVYEFRFRYQTRLSLGYRMFDQEDEETSHTIYARITKSF